MLRTNHLSKYQVAQKRPCQICLPSLSGCWSSRFQILGVWSLDGPRRFLYWQYLAILPCPVVVFLKRPRKQFRTFPPDAATIRVRIGDSYSPGSPGPCEHANQASHWISCSSARLRPFFNFWWRSNESPSQQDNAMWRSFWRARKHIDSYRHKVRQNDRNFLWKPASMPCLLVGPSLPDLIANPRSSISSWNIRHTRSHKVLAHAQELHLRETSRTSRIWWFDFDDFDLICFAIVCPDCFACLRSTCQPQISCGSSGHLAKRVQSVDMMDIHQSSFLHDGVFVVPSCFIHCDVVFTSVPGQDGGGSFSMFQP